MYVITNGKHSDNRKITSQLTRGVLKWVRACVRALMKYVCCEL